MTEENKTNKNFSIKFRQWFNNFFSQTTTKVYGIAFIINICIFTFFKNFTIFPIFNSTLKMGLVNIIISFIFCLASFVCAYINIKNKKRYKNFYFLTIGLISIFPFIFASNLNDINIFAITTLVISFLVSFSVYISSLILAILVDLIKNKENTVKFIKTNKNKFFIIVLVCFIIFCSSFIINKINNKDKLPFMDYGKWEVIDEHFYKDINEFHTHVLKNGNVLIIGKGKFYSSDSNINVWGYIFDEKSEKIIETIPLFSEKCTHLYSLSMKNGDVFIVTKRPKEKGEYKISCYLLDSNTYKVKFLKSIDKCDSIVLIDNNNVLILPSIVYNPYTKTTLPVAFDKKVNQNISFTDTNIFYFPNGDLLTGTYIYKTNENRIEVNNKIYRFNDLFVPIDSNSYLALLTTSEYTIGNLFDVVEEKEIHVKNKINRVWRISSSYKPIAVPLNDGKALLLGINLKSTKGEQGANRRKSIKKNNSSKKNTAYIYDKKQNMFFETKPPFYKIADKNNCSFVTLQKGYFHFVGGEDNNKKIQIYKKMVNKN